MKTLRQCFNFLAINEATLRVDRDPETAGRNYIVMTFPLKDGDGRHVCTGFSTVQEAEDIPFGELLPLLCKTALDNYEGLKDE